MTERTDHRICIKFCIKFCFNLGKSCPETIEMIQKPFVDESLDITQINEWYRRLELVAHLLTVTLVLADLRWQQHRKTSSVCNLRIEGDRRLTVRELENDLGIPKTTVWEIFNKILGMIRVCVVTGFFTTITLQRIHRTLCRNFWRNKRLYSFATLLTVPT